MLFSSLSRSTGRSNSAPRVTSPSSSSSSSLSPSSSSSPTTTASPMGFSLWFVALMLLLLLFAAQQQPCECRYLPTRSHGDDLDKLRELILQILESSTEEQLLRPPNEANGNTLGQRTNWLNRLGGSADNVDMPRKYPARGPYDNGRYY